MVAQAHDSRNDETMGVPTTRLMRTETNAYVENQKKSDFYKNITTYLTWGATALLGLFVLFTAASYLPGIASVLGFAEGAAIPLSAFLITGIAGAAAAVGSIFTSNKATEIGERGNVLYSDIDSQNQAHRMVQAFAKAQTQGTVVADNTAPMTSTAPSWTERAGGSRSQGGSWQERIAAEAAREEAQTLSAVQQFSR